MVIAHIKKHPNVVLHFLFSNPEDRRFMMRLMKRAGVDFNKFLETKTDDEKTSDFYQVYKEDYQKFLNLFCEYWFHSIKLILRIITN